MQYPQAGCLPLWSRLCVIVFLLAPGGICLAEDIVEEPTEAEVQKSAEIASRRAAFGQVLAALENGEQKLQKISPARVAGAKEELITALRELEPVLGANPAGWKSYLMWEELSAQLQVAGKAADTELDYEVLEKIYLRYEGNHEGLELPQFQKVRRALRRYSDLSYNAQEGFLALAREQVKGVKERIAAYIDRPNLEDAHLIGLYAGWLESVEQLPEITSLIRNRFQQPNLYARINAPLVQAALVRPSNSTDDVNEVILGTRITGTATTQGLVTAQLVPSSDAVGLEFQFRGQTISDTVGRQSLVTILSTSTVDFVAKKRVFIRTGKDDLWRTGVRATLDNRTNCVDVDSPFKCKPVAKLTQPIVRRAALKRIAESKPAANEIARQRARGRLMRSFDEQAAPMLRQTRQQINNRLIATLKRLDEYPRQLQLSTTQSHIQFQALHHDSYGIGAATPPVVVEGQHDIVIQIHESMIASAGRRRLANKSFASDAGGGLEEQLGVLEKFVTFGDVPKPAEAMPEETEKPAPDDAAPPGDDAAPPAGDAAPPGDDAMPPGNDAAPPGDDAMPPGNDAVPPGDDAMPPGDALPPGENPPGEKPDGNEDAAREDARVTLASALPLAIYFDKTGIRIAIRLSRITTGDRDIQDTVEISAVYKPEQMGGVFRLVKQGELQVSFPNPVTSRIEQAAVQSLLKKRIESMFKDYVEFKEIDPPQQFADKTGKLHVTGIDARDGWLTLGFSAEKLMHTGQ